ncbi:MAG: Ppx/GppA family phosphatase [Actinobacteria bacterium]|nr:Ppx/GppA family phosphatase [Actinomycetota bacterium]
MNLASIDVGTNSTRLLITEFNNGIFTPLIRKMEITRLGKGIKETGNISYENAELTLETLKKYKLIIDKYDVENFKAVGTSALRRAKNSNDFINLVFNNTGIKIEIINARDEARYSFNGALKSLIMADKFAISEKLLVSDIGGGSSEFIFGNKDFSFFRTQSIDIGCVRATEEFLKSDPPTADELLLLQLKIKEKFNKELINYYENKEFVILGLAGTISSLAGISIGLKKYKMESLNYMSLNLKVIKEIFQRLCKLNLKQRRKVAGLDPKRADVIIGGTAIVLEMLDYFKKEIIIVSENDILDGIVYSLINI